MTTQFKFMLVFAFIAIMALGLYADYETTNIFFQVMFLITSAILDDKKNFDFFIEKIQTDGPIDFDLNKIQEELKYNY